MLLERVLSHSEIRKVVKDNQDSLSQFVSHYGQKVIGERLELVHIENFKKNYQSLISILSEQNSPELNNFSLHFIATVSSGYLKFNRIDQAKQILKKSEVYLQGTFTDPLLLVVCLNNLANIQKIKQKHYKSLRLSLKALEVMTSHMESLRLKKSKQRLREDSVVFLIVIIRCKLTLSTILNKNEHKYFRKAYELMNYLGYRSCLRYLGQDSIFIKRFTPVQKQFHLPIFKTQEKIQKKHENENERLILEQLSKIHDVLKSKQNPDVIVINTQQNQTESRIQVNQTEHSIFVNQIQSVQEMPKIPRPMTRSLPKKEQKPVEIVKQKQISIEEQLIRIQSQIKQGQQQPHGDPTPQYIPSDSQQSQQAVVAEQTIFIDKWQIKLKLERQKNQSLGTLFFESSRSSINKKKKEKKDIQLTQQKLEKIVNQINFQDLLPYQFFNEQLNEEEFIEYNIKPFLNIDQRNGEVIIQPKAKGLFDPFTMKVFSQQSLIFFNHVRTNLFRASISPIFSFKSIYLNIEFCPESMLTFFTFQEQVNDYFTAIFKSMSNQQNAGNPSQIKDKTKTCTLIARQDLISYLKQIIAQFQSLIITREDQTSVNQILENELFYYKYRQTNNQRKGMYYLIRYLPGINCFDVYLKNNYLTFASDQKIKSRGNILYKYKDFFQDFGVPLKCSFSKRKLFAYLEIIAKKYTLLTFDSPLSQCDQDAYLENALLQFPITESCFKIKIYPKNDYCTALTISLLTINNEFPVGIKVQEYNAEEVLSRGFFIHIVPQEWVRPMRRPCPWVNNVLFKTFINQFDFRRDYFIGEWLQRKGFDLLFQRIMDPGHSLYLQNNINRFIRGKSIIDIFNQTSKISN